MAIATRAITNCCLRQRWTMSLHFPSDWELNRCGNLGLRYPAFQESGSEEEPNRQCLAQTRLHEGVGRNSRNPGGRRAFLPFGPSCTRWAHRSLERSLPIVDIQRGFVLAFQFAIEIPLECPCPLNRPHADWPSEWRRRSAAHRGDQHQAAECADAGGEKAVDVGQH